MATVILLRHGETDWNREELVQGWAPVALNDRGREQARAAGEHLAATYDIGRVVVSDLRRTRETATLVGDEGIEPEPVFDRDWRERGFGVLQGLGYEAVFGEHPEYDVASGNADALEARPENGESLLDCRDRVLRGWQSVLDDIDADETVLVVTHGGPIYVLLAHVEGVDLPTMFAREHQHNCAINELRVEAVTADVDPTVEVVRRNDTSYREN